MFTKRKFPILAVFGVLALAAVIIAGVNANKRVNAVDVFPPLDENFLFKVSAENLTPVYPIRDASNVQIAVINTAEDAFTARVQALENASKSIRIQALTYYADESGLYIADILKRKKAEGLDVRVIVDGSFNLGLLRQNMYYDLEQHGVDMEGYDSLLYAGTDNINNRYHEKLWIVDGEEADGSVILGGSNIGNIYFDIEDEASRRWRDQDVMVKGDIVYDTVAAFDRNFVHLQALKAAANAVDTTADTATTDTTDSSIDIDAITSPINDWLSLAKEKLSTYQEVTDLANTIRQQADAIATEINDQAVQIFGSDIGLISDSISTEIQERAARVFDIDFQFTSEAFNNEVLRIANRDIILDFQPSKARFLDTPLPRGEYVYPTYNLQAYLAMVGAAQQEIVIENAYFIPVSSFRDAIIAAANRGVKVSIIVNSAESINLPQMIPMQRYYYKELLEGGGANLDIYEWQGSETDGTLHSKFAIFDGSVSMVGSYNLDPRSEILNSESDLVFRSDVLAGQLIGLAAQDILKSRLVTLEEALQYNAPENPWDIFNLETSLWLENWL